MITLSTLYTIIGRSKRATYKSYTTDANKDSEYFSHSDYIRVFKDGKEITKTTDSDLVLISHMRKDIRYLTDMILLLVYNTFDDWDSLDQQICEIEARYKNSSTGEWKSLIEGRDFLSGSSFIQTNNEDIEFIGAKIADIDFIAYAKQDLKKLLLEIQELRAYSKDTYTDV